MDPVQYIIILIEQGKTPDEAYAHTRQRFGLTNGEIEQMILDARSVATDLLAATENLV